MRFRFVLHLASFIAAGLSLAQQSQGLVLIPQPGGGFSTFQHDPVRRSLPAALANAQNTYLMGVPGHLATFRSATEQHFVHTMLGPRNRWIGLTDDPAFGGVEHGNTGSLPLQDPLLGPVQGPGHRGAGFRWITGEPLTFHTWENGQPGGGGSFIRLGGSENWLNDGDSSTFFSIIEHDLPAPPFQLDAFKVKLVDLYNGVFNRDIADKVLAGEIPAAVTTGNLAVLNLRDSGSDGNVPGGLPVPGLVQDVNNENFVSKNTGTLNVITPGVYTFAFNSDDGGRLSIDGVMLAQFFGQRGAADTMAPPIELSAGAHTFEFIWSESHSEASAEVVYAPGFKTAVDGDFRLLGDGSGGIAVPGGITSQTFVVTLNPNLNLSAGIGLTGLGGADALLRGELPAIVTEYYATVLFAQDQRARGNDYGGLFDGADLFFGTIDTDDADHWALQATGLLEITEADVYTFGIGSDDGARLVIDGVAVILDDAFHGFRDIYGSIFLTAGFHTIELTYFEGGGDAALALFAARGVHNSFDPGVFRLVGDTANGGLRVTQSAGASIPEPAAMLLSIIAGMFVWRRRGAFQQ